ncbi:hypothetical protein [Chlamydia pecorum]|uniref:Uncharacterized protein n=2 Tax=Chlamydia pecorum TaxID=85991 RepID=A0AA34RC74_CHLPE|nr:hypothetical protein [Chlamydia pecorum]AEB41066.1 conserved hypothetical protein [Chlamydia pecorum E58]AGW38207.1 hypothetical protein CPE1_0729 [Chlamydia pecorum PV3056/3]AGW39131.1 hypothetical protein CPE2_0730 [Chlamydia pecorum W73]AGW40057.1 hypothetical protein CPE3_0730 [Chlamydia pecorum P787]ETF38420.1 hypothetical protein CpecS_0028 [Chlamydia pecorum VR629]
MKNKLIQLLDELYECQREKVQELGEELVPHLTSDDVLQPMDFAELEENPAFRFEEGVLSGIGEVRAALRAFFAEG